MIVKTIEKRRRRKEILFVILFLFIHREKRKKIAWILIIGEISHVLIIIDKWWIMNKTQPYEYLFQTRLFLSQWISRPRAYARIHILRFRDRVLTSFPPEFKILVEQERTGGGAIDRRCLPTRERENLRSNPTLLFFSPSWIRWLKVFGRKLTVISLQCFR